MICTTFRSDFGVSWKNQNNHSTLNSSFDALSKWHEPDIRSEKDLVKNAPLWNEAKKNKKKSWHCQTARHRRSRYRFPHQLCSLDHWIQQRSMCLLQSSDLEIVQGWVAKTPKKLFTFANLYHIISDGCSTDWQKRTVHF